ncbi:hypothetical protein DID78_06805 [Candidatus Marinamargulisbacteria bacterium SCGC AG-343-D04]|nr:hypothetical protein DID78_06805 [Candidatus Marinamargulisbacteria bacterium SCGC AG-343-D04]
MKNIGYIKSISKDDELLAQKESLKNMGCTVIFKDIVNSSKKERPGFQTLLESLHEDDVVVVHSLDKLGASVNQLIDNIGEIQKRNAHIKTIEEDVDTTSMSSFYEYFNLLKRSKEQMFKERTRPGRKGAIARGRMGGRPEKVFDEDIKKIKELYHNNVPVRIICEKMKISRPTLYKYLKK